LASKSGHTPFPLVREFRDICFSIWPGQLDARVSTMLFIVVLSQLFYIVFCLDQLLDSENPAYVYSVFLSLPNSEFHDICFSIWPGQLDARVSTMLFIVVLSQLFYIVFCLDQLLDSENPGYVYSFSVARAELVQNP